MPRATTEPYLLRGFKGLNEGDLPENIQDAEFQTLENFYPHEGILRRRSGLDRISGTAAGEAVSSLTAFKTSTGSWTLIGGGLTQLFRIPPGTDAFTAIAGSTFATSTNLWSFEQYKDVLYAARQGVGLFRTDGDVVSTGGIAAPTVAPTIVQGSAGDLAAGAYFCVFTYYNSASGAESDPSPASASLTISANFEIDWSAISVSATGQVNSRRLYRTLVGQQGEYFRVATLTDNVTTTYSDNILLVDMGRAVSFNNGMPPSGVRACEIFQERLWLTDGTKAWYSELGLPESFRSDNFISVTPDDGHELIGIKAFGERVLFGKTNGVHYLTGTSANTFEVRTLSDKHGCQSHHSMQVAEGFAFWFGGDNFYMTDGNSVIAIGDVNVRDSVDGIASTDYKLVNSIVDATNRWYISVVRTSTVWKLLVYNYRTQQWCTFVYGGSRTPTSLSDFFDANGAQLIYVTLENADGHAYRFNNTADDFGTDIVCTLRTKNFGYNADNMLKFMKEVEVLLSTTGEAEDLVMTLYADDTAASQDTVTINTFERKLWKRTTLANNGELGNFLSFEMVYTGNADISIAGLAFKIVNTQRQVAVA